MPANILHLSFRVMNGSEKLIIQLMYLLSLYQPLFQIINKFNAKSSIQYNIICSILFKTTLHKLQIQQAPTT